MYETGCFSTAVLYQAGYHVSSAYAIGSAIRAAGGRLKLEEILHEKHDVVSFFLGKPSLPVLRFASCEAAIAGGRLKLEEHWAYPRPRDELFRRRNGEHSTSAAPGGALPQAMHRRGLAGQDTVAASMSAAVSTWDSSIHSSAVCAWAIEPGPNTRLGTPAAANTLALVP